MKKILSVILLSLLTAPSCGRLDIAFNWADTFIISKIDDYFDINSDQRTLLKQNLKADLNEVRAKELPQWIKEGRRLEDALNKNTLSKADLRHTLSFVFNNMDQVGGYFSQTAEKFLATAKNQQWQVFQKELSKQNLEDRQKHQNTQKYAQEMRNKYHKYFKMFLGSLNREQIELIDVHLKNHPYPTDLKIQNKEYLFGQFRSGKISGQDLIKLNEFQLPSYRKAVKTYRQDLGLTLEKIENTLSSEQRQALLKNLKKKISQLQSLQERS